MDKVGIAAIYRNRKISAPHPEWATDLTYIPPRQGFVYLVAIIDWATRWVLAHRHQSA
jgi:putative transposase